MELNELKKIPLSYSQSHSQYSLSEIKYSNNTNKVNNNNTNYKSNIIVEKMVYDPQLQQQQQDSNQNGYFQEIPIGLNHIPNNSNGTLVNSGITNNGDSTNNISSDNEANGANIKPTYSINSYPTNFVQPYYQTDKIFVIPGMGGVTAGGGSTSRYSKFSQISENFTFTLRILVFPMIATYISILLPLSKPYAGFLLGWQYTVMYIPVVTAFISFMIIGWCQVFVRGVCNWLVPMAAHLIITSVTFSCISQYSSSYPPPIVIGVSYGLSATILPLFLYLRSSDRLKKGFLIDFSKFMMFIIFMISTVFICVTFVIFFSLIEAQTAVMLVFFFVIFLCNQALLWVTRKYCPVNQHNIITYWTESISEMTICWVYSRFTKMNFLILLILRVVFMFRYLFFLSDRYWNYRTTIKEHYDRTRSNTWLTSVNNFEKPYYTVVSQFFPISMERNEHMTRVVDRVLYTFLSYCSIPLIYILFSVCLRFSYNSKFYPFDISIEAYMLGLIYAMFTSFLSYMIFLTIRYLFQIKYDISLLNHPIQIFKKNATILMYSNFSAFIIPITFVLMHNNIFFLVNSGESLYYN